jgi:putative phosphoribosyl transferase
LAALRGRGTARIVLAVPVAPVEARADFAGLADDILILEEPRDFWAVGAHYRSFPQTSDADVIATLAAARPSPA